MEKLIFHCFCLIFSVAEISLQLYIVSAWIMCDFKHVFLMEWSKYVSARRGHSMLTNISKTSSRVSSTPNSFDTNGIKADVWWIIPVIITSICRDPRLSLSVYTCKHEKKKKKKHDKAAVWDHLSGECSEDPSPKINFAETAHKSISWLGFLSTART